jgi:D-tyrosyl-tRNA(Tyr) deacylase
MGGDMRALIQRVREASVEVSGESIARIGRGLLVLLGVGLHDDARRADWVVDKLLSLRLFDRAERRFDASVVEVGGALLVISQFTLYAETKKGRRPSFSGAAPPAAAQALYERVLTSIAARGVELAAGRFGADMAVHLTNDGPVTLWLDSEAV